MQCDRGVPARLTRTWRRLARWGVSLAACSLTGASAFASVPYSGYEPDPFAMLLLMLEFGLGGVFASGIGWLALIALAVLGVVWWRKRQKARAAAGVPRKRPFEGWTMERVRTLLLGSIIALLLPLFVQLITRSVGPPAGEAFMVLGLWVEIILGVVFFGAGVLVRRVPLVSRALLAGACLSVIFTVSIRFPDFSTGAKLLVSALVLFLTVTGSIWSTARDHARGLPKPTLSGAAGFGVGLLAFLFSLMTVQYARAYLGDVLTDPRGDSRASAALNADFVALLVLGVLYFGVGVAARAVGKGPGIALLLAGTITVVQALFVGFAEFGHATAAVATGLSLIVLVGIAYVKFGRPQPPAPAPPVPKRPAS